MVNNLNETSKFLKRKIKTLQRLQEKLKDEHNKTTEKLRYYQAVDLGKRLDKKQIKRLK